MTTQVAQMIVLAAFVLFPSSFRQSPGMSLLCHPDIPPDITSLSPQFVISAILVISMGAIRVWCYHALGTLFTFQITVRENHRLVNTGPYAYVRHPGYTSLIFVLIGMMAMSLD